MEKKRQRFFNLKSIDAVAKRVTALVSDFTWDRTGERFAKGAWKLDNFLVNPVVLWAHDQHSLPIAKCVNISENEFGLLADMQFDHESEFAMQVFSLLERGFLNTFSVGFIPSKFMMENMDGENKGYVWTEAELLEFSVVPVPANAGAVIQRNERDFMVKAFGEDSIIQVEVGGLLEDHLKAMDLPAQEPFMPEETPEPEFKIEEPEEDNFQKALKSLNEIARMRTGTKLDEAGVSLVKSTLGILTEIVTESEDNISDQDVEKLGAIVADLAEFVKTNKPDYADTVSKILMQITARKNTGRGK